MPVATRRTFPLSHSGHAQRGQLRTSQRCIATGCCAHGVTEQMATDRHHCPDFPRGCVRVLQLRSCTSVGGCKAHAHAYMCACRMVSRWCHGIASLADAVARLRLFAPASKSNRTCFSDCCSCRDNPQHRESDAQWEIEAGQSVARNYCHPGHQNARAVKTRARVRVGHRKGANWISRGCGSPHKVSVG